jgi:hypothetical protein
MGFASKQSKPQHHFFKFYALQKNKNGITVRPNQAKIQIFINRLYLLEKSYPKGVLYGKKKYAND